MQKTDNNGDANSNPLRTISDPPLSAHAQTRLYTPKSRTILETLGTDNYEKDLEPSQINEIV